MGMHPRWIQADKVYAQTQRTIDRQFLFKPDPTVCNIIGASAVRAQKKHPVHIYWLEFNINHEQNGIAPLSDSYDDLNNVVLFKQTFHKNLVFELNVHFGREGGMFSTPPRTVPCLDNQSLEQQFFYALTNPVKDGLVDRIEHWKGFSSYKQLARGEDQLFTWFDRTAWHRDGKKKKIQAYLKSDRLEYTPLPSLAHMTPGERESYIRKEVRAIEKACREKRKKNAQQVPTPAKLEKIDPRDRPKTHPPRTRKPLCHCACPALAEMYKQLLFHFLDAYGRASALYRQGNHNTIFPAGSYKPPLIVMNA
jgi:hypothetical protein